MTVKLHLLSIIMLLLVLLLPVSPLVLAFDDIQKEQSEHLQQRREPKATATATTLPHHQHLSSYYLRSADAVARRDGNSNNNNNIHHLEENDGIENESITTTTEQNQRLLAKSKSSSSSSSSNKSKKKRIKIPPPPLRMMNVTVTNLSFRQPFGSLFVMIYDRNRDIDDALGIEEPSLFRLGHPSSPELRELAEHDDPSHLVIKSKQYQQVYGAFTVHHQNQQHLAGGQSVTFQVPDSAAISPDDHKREAKRYITIAGMLQNTNDGFVAVNGVHYHHRSSLFAPAYDAGTEENNEDCASILGPACTSSVMDGNVDSGNGEGFVHIHRGISGRGTTLTIDEHDWKNPIMEITFMLI